MSHADTIHVHVSRFTAEELADKLALNCDENTAVFNALFKRVSTRPYSLLLDTILFYQYPNHYQKYRNQSFDLGAKILVLF